VPLGSSAKARLVDSLVDGHRPKAEIPKSPAKPVSAIQLLCPVVPWMAILLGGFDEGG